MLRAYIKKYGIKCQDLDSFNLALAQISVKNHANATKNKYAQYQRKITVEQVLNERKKAHKPLGLFDFAPISDGASALILTSEEKAKKLTDKPVYILGCASATDFLNYPSREDLSHFVSAQLAMKKAQQKANVDVGEIQVVELYDQSTMMQMVSLEDLGFCKPGSAWRTINESCQNNQEIKVNGKEVYVNTNGGLKADGNPLGATGGAEIYEIYRQLRGEAGERQGAGSPKFGCALEFEGFGTKAYVSILGRETP